MSDNERVLCVPRDYYYSGDWVDDPVDTLKNLIERSVYLHRKSVGEYVGCEQDERFLQLLPYIAVINPRGELLCYQRRKGGEARLDGLWSIGIGGHVNDGDSNWMAGVTREIGEELSGLSIGQLYDVGGFADPEGLSNPIGFIRDDSNAVGRVHLGVLYVLEVPDGVTYREHDGWRWFAPDFISVSDDVGRDLENWSRIALPMVQTWMEKSSSFSTQEKQ